VKRRNRLLDYWPFAFLVVVWFVVVYVTAR
jgi:hypothetical protein